MKMLFEISAMATMDESAELKYSRFIDSLSSFENDWKIDRSAFPRLNFGREFTAIIELKNQPQKGVKPTLFFRYRNMLTDRHSSDDRVYIEFNSKKVDYRSLVQTVFEYYVKAFNGYFARLCPESLVFEDFEITRHKNYREFIPRFYPVMFVNDKMCAKAFKISPDVLADLLSKHVEKVWRFNEGLAYIYSSSPSTAEECNEFNHKIKGELQEIQQ